MNVDIITAVPHGFKVGERATDNNGVEYVVTKVHDNNSLTLRPVDWMDRTKDFCKETWLEFKQLCKENWRKFNEYLDSTDG